MKKYLVAVPVLAVVGLVIGLGISDKVVWSWENSTKGNNINYCMLIGQLDHNDSGARTKGVRDALGTRVPTNPELPNVEPSKQGKLKIEITGHGTLFYNVNELHAKECKSDAGVTWDQATAALTATSWYSKYREDLTMIISNNDGMAEGALLTRNAIKGMPIFGYDSNSSTLDKIQKEHSIKGTINSNAPAQAFAIYNTVARVLDGLKDSKHVAPKEGASETDWDNWYSWLFSGMKVSIDKAAEKEFKNKGDNVNPYVSSGNFVKDFKDNDINFTYDSSTKALKVNSIKIDEDNVQEYNVPAGNQIVHNITMSSTENRNVLQCAYSATDNYLTSTLVPIFEGTVPNFGLNYGSIVCGDGNDESDLLNKVKMPDKANAYILNIVKTVDANMFLGGIYGKCKNDEEFAKTPIIFYNRQPTKPDGSPDEDVMHYYLDSNNVKHYNPYIYYVGFDADEGGELQGELVIDWLQKEFAAEYGIKEDIEHNVIIEAVE